MNNLKLFIFFQFTLVLFLSPVRANNEIKQLTEEDVCRFIETVKDAKVSQSGYNANQENVDKIFEILQFFKERKPYDSPIQIDFYIHARAFLISADVNSLALKLTQEYLNFQYEGKYRVFLLIEKAVTYHNTGKYNKSILSFNQAINYAKEIGFDSEIPHLYKHKSHIYWCKGLESGDDFSDSRLELNNKALKLFIKLNDIKGIQSTYADIGSLTNNVKEASSFFDKAIKITNENLDIYSNNKYEINYLLNRYATQLLVLNEPTEAFKRIEKIDDFYLYNTFDSLNHFLLLANYHIAKNNNTEAKKIVDLSISLFKKYNNKDSHRLGFLRSYSKIYKKLGDTKQFKNIQTQINDQIDKVGFSQDFLDFELNRIRTEKKRNEQSLAKNKKRLSNTKLSIILSVIILILSIFISLFYRKRYQSKAKSVELVRGEQEKLINNNKEIHKINTTLGYQTNQLEAQLKTKLLLLSNREQVISSLISEIDILSIDEEKKILLKRIIRQNEEGEQWKRVEEEFLDADNKFVNKLLLLNPKLSPKNMKLCTLIKLGLSNKEIAEITSSSLGSVKVAKTRLRKHLGIENVSTYNFLKQIDEII